MEQLFTVKETLQKQLDAEWISYNNAIKSDRPFEEVKIIYLHIKELQHQIGEITDKIHSKLKLGN